MLWKPHPSDRKVAELTRALTQKDELISDLRKDMAALKKMYDIKLEVANKEIGVLKDNLCAVKKVKAVDNRGNEAIQKNYKDALSEIEKLKKLVVKLERENDGYRKRLAAGGESSGMGAVRVSLGHMAVQHPIPQLQPQQQNYYHHR